jgi:HAE1 family hydrophobic/amphiphilic exporter-1
MRAIGQIEAMNRARERLASIEGAQIRVEVVPRVSGGGFRATDIQMEFRGSDLGELESFARRMMAKMRSADAYRDIDTSYETGRPEVGIVFRRDRAAHLAVSPLSVASTVRALIGGEDVAFYKAEGDRYDIRVRLFGSQRRRLADIGLIKVRNARGDLISIDNVATIAPREGPVQIDRYNRARQVTIYANLDKTKKVLGDAIPELERFAEELSLPPGYSFRFAGQAADMAESFGHLFFALGLATLIVYMVLAAQFESFFHPFTIMLSLPLSIVGAFGALVASGMTLSIFTMIGVIMLMGLVTKNGILLVDYTNTLRNRDGLDRDSAIRKAGPARLRPILMTSAALIFGMLPVALGRGAGSESRAPMAVSVIGGLTTSTILTLVVIPVAYTLVDDLAAKIRRLVDSGLLFASETALE